MQGTGAFGSATPSHPSRQRVTFSILDLALAITEDLTDEDAERENSRTAQDQVPVCKTPPDDAI